MSRKVEMIFGWHQIYKRVYDTIRATHAHPLELVFIINVFPSRKHGFRTKSAFCGIINAPWNTAESKQWDTGKVYIKKIWWHKYSCHILFLNMSYFLPTIQICTKEKRNLSDLSTESHLDTFFGFFLSCEAKIG